MNPLNPLNPQKLLDGFRSEVQFTMKIFVS